ncbi:hypothetical protein Hanom_Chr03g00240511 [Helianthus anomalus]
MLVHLTKRTKLRICVRLFNKQTNTNELPAEQFTKCLPNVWFIRSPTPRHSFQDQRSLLATLQKPHFPARNCLNRSKTIIPALNKPKTCLKPLKIVFLYYASSAPHFL